MVDREILDEILGEYEEQRSKNETERAMRKKRVYAKYPELADIDSEINSIGNSTVLAIMREPDKKAELKESMEGKFRILKKRREEIIAQNNIEPDFDKLRYRCEKCADTGYIENVGRCSCFETKLKIANYRNSNMSELAAECRFCNFRIDYYSDEPVENEELTPRQNIINIKKYCEDFIENFGSTRSGIIMWGDTGTGKTFTSSCIARELMLRGKTVLYYSAAQIFRMFDDARFGRLADGMDKVYECDLLIIDDLGTEAELRSNNSYILELINERMISKKPVIINTNLTFAEIESRYSKRVSSRLLENYAMMKFYGTDIRMQKLKEAHQ